MKSIIATLLFVSLVLSSSFIQLSFASPAAAPSPAPPSYCDGKCGERCAKAGMKDRCLKYCGICCQECKCVPSGTYGNKSECPCYRDKKNSKHQPKCP
ncbi:hypothetical protein Goshw_001365 [Gossypium schwendimanii]|uniref:Snakin-1 n=5 Tax=Gossypium TaxID=3633 RepID=A0A9D3VH11_9ROSI|nr:hypothetical protein J1N35_022143 [Gossypium stocksii]MBA0560904.1 hypothetical protein [Gossypium lobatum]MBA0686820.1 hypothetical protein [Gossypium aridum]MBA0715835.1 hypothetical protein [Gossypium laxum]MBA0858874.1 hypothetical protein [Gossypium schwendimanii]